MKTMMPYWKRLLGVGEKVLMDHDEEASLGDASGDGLSSSSSEEEEEGSAIKSRIVSSHRN
jgi:hypothetical protein